MNSWKELSEELIVLAQSYSREWLCLPDRGQIFSEEVEAETDSWCSELCNSYPTPVSPPAHLHAPILARLIVAADCAALSATEGGDFPFDTFQVPASVLLVAAWKVGKAKWYSGEDGLSFPM